MGSDRSPGLVKLFIEASTKEELVVLQIRNNVINNTRFIYDTPMKDGDKWVAWYFGQVDETVIIKEAMTKIKGAK